MSRFKIGALKVAGALVALTFSSVSHGEDSLVGNGLLRGIAYQTAIANTRPGSLLVGLKGSFEISVAYIGVGEFDRGKRARCGPVKVRIDAAFYDADAGGTESGLRKLEFEPLGNVMTLDPGTWYQESYSNPTGQQTVASDRTDRDVVAFRLRSEQPKPGCNLIASGLFVPFSDSNASGAIPFALLPSVSTQKGRYSHDHR